MSDVMSFLEGLNPTVQILSALGALGVGWRIVRAGFKWFPSLPDGVSKDSQERAAKGERPKEEHTVRTIERWIKLSGVNHKRLMEGQWTTEPLKEEHGPLCKNCGGWYAECPGPLCLLCYHKKKAAEEPLKDGHVYPATEVALRDMPGDGPAFIELGGFTKINMEALEQAKKRQENNIERLEALENMKRIDASFGMVDTPSGKAKEEFKHCQECGGGFIQPAGEWDSFCLPCAKRFVSRKAKEGPLAERQKDALYLHRVLRGEYTLDHCCLDCVTIIPTSRFRCDECHQNYWRRMFSRGTSHE